MASCNTLKVTMVGLKKRLRKPTLAAFLKLGGWVAVVATFVVFSNQGWSRILPTRTVDIAAAGILLALAGHLFAQARDVAETREKSSLFYLESCVKAYEEARRLLDDENNDRKAWIGAGRALGHAKELSKGVTQVAHIRVLELHRLKYRSFFDGCLRGKTAAFFYGAKDPSVSTAEAAASSTAPERRGEVYASTTVKALSRESLRAVWEAAQWPEPFEDPLNTNFSKVEQSRLVVLYPGLHDFLNFEEQNRSASGKIFPSDSQ